MALSILFNRACGTAAAGAAAALVLSCAASAQYYEYGGDPFASDAYSDGCGDLRQKRAAAGAVIGGLIGGVIGSSAAADGVRGEGGALGAAVGAALGGAIGNEAVDCRDIPKRPEGVYDIGYQNTPYIEDVYEERGLVGAPPARRIEDPRYDQRRYDDGPASGDYDFASRQCQKVYRITILPDGTEIREPVEACRDAYYGDWDVAE